MANQPRSFWDSPSTPQGGGFWDTPAPSASNQIASVGKMGHEARLRQYEEEARIAQEESRQANSLSQRLGRPVLESFSKFGGEPFFKAVASASSVLKGSAYQPKNEFQKTLVGGKDSVSPVTQGEDLGIKNPALAAIAGLGITALDLNPLTSGKAKTAKEAVDVSTDTLSYLAKLKATKVAAETAGNPSGLISKTKAVASTLKAKFIDFTAPINDTLSKSLRDNKMSLPASENIGNQIDRSLRAPSLYRQFVSESGFENVVKKVDDADAFDEYLIAKQAIDVDTRGIKTGRDMAKDSLLVRELAPKYEDLAQETYKFSQTLLDKSVNYGLISADLAAQLKRMYPNYVPLKRVFSEIEEANKFNNGTGVASNASQSIVQKLKGSDRAIESPINSLYEKGMDVFAQGERNLAGKMLASYEKLPGNPFGLKELGGTFEDVETGKKIYGLAKQSAEHTISFLDNGVKRTFETFPEIAAAAKALNVQQLNLFQRIMALPVRVARLGFTALSPAFVAANLARDQLTALVNTQHATSVFHPANIVRGIYQAVRHGDLYDEAVKQGALGTSYDIARDMIPETIDKIRASRSAKEYAWHVVKHPKDMLRMVEDIFSRTEEATRLQVYRGTRDALIKQGLSEAEAMTQAAQSARQGTVDFMRRGEYGTAINSVWLYINANIQGVRTLTRALKDRPTETLAKIAMTGVLPVATITAYNLSDPERKKIYEDIPEYEKDNNLIFIGPNAKKGEDGRWEGVYKIPHSQEIRQLLQLPRRVVEQSFDLDPVRGMEVAQSLLGNFSPAGSSLGEIGAFVVPQAFKPGIQAWSGKDMFTGANTVPKNMEGLPPEMQVKDSTSGFAKGVGSAFGVSPVKVDKFGKDTLGSIFETATGKNPLTKVGERFTSTSGGAEDDKEIEALAGTIKEQKGKAFSVKKEAEAMWEEIKAVKEEKGREEAIQMIEEIGKENPALADKIIEVAEEEKMGLSTTDKLIKQLGVENGERAKYIRKKLEALSSREEKEAYLQDLIDKGLVSDTVAEQLSQLKK